MELHIEKRLLNCSETVFNGQFPLINSEKLKVKVGIQVFVQFPQPQSTRAVHFKATGISIRVKVHVDLHGQYNSIGVPMVFP